MEALLKERLPSEWSYAVDRDGRIFFVNDDHKTTTWIHPTWKHAVQSGHFSEQNFPTGWEADFTDGNTQYFIDHNSASTSWHLPSEKSRTSRELKRSTSPFKRSSSKRKSQKQNRSIDVKRDVNSEVVLRDWLYRQEGGVGPLKTWKKRWCVLSGLCLFIYKGPEEGNLLGSVCLPSYKIIPGQKDQANKKFIFKAEHENMKSSHFAGDTSEQAEKWMEAMSLASVGVDGTTAESGDDLRESKSEDHDLDRSPNFRSSFDRRPTEPDQNAEDDFCRASVEGRGKQSYDYYQMGRIPNQQISHKMLIQTKSVNQDTHMMPERDELRSSEAAATYSGDDVFSKIGVQHRRAVDVSKSFLQEDEMVPRYEMEENSFARVKEWTEEQNKYRHKISQSDEQMPLKNLPSADVRLEPGRNVRQGGADETTPASQRNDANRNPQDCNQYLTDRLNNVRHCNQFNDFTQDQFDRELFHFKHSSTTSSAGNAINLSRQSSKNNSETQELEINKLKMHHKTSLASSNLSDSVKREKTYPSPEEMYSKVRSPKTSVDLPSPEPYGATNITDLLLRNKNRLRHAHHLLEVFSQTRPASVSKDQLVEALISLRRNQAVLHESLYITMKEDATADSYEQQQIIEEQIDQNSQIIGELEKCLYNLSSKTSGIAETFNNKHNKIITDRSMEAPNQSLSEDKADFFVSKRNQLTAQATGSPMGIAVAPNPTARKPLDRNLYCNTAVSIQKEDPVGAEIETKKPFEDGFLEPTFLETDLDLMQTRNIATFSYGVKPSDLLKSPVFKNPHKPPELRDPLVEKEYKTKECNNLSSQHPANHQHHYQAHVPVAPRRSLQGHHVQQRTQQDNHFDDYKRFPANESEESHRSRPGTLNWDCYAREEEKFKCKQSIIPLKSSDEGHLPGYHDVWSKQDQPSRLDGNKRVLSLSDDNLNDEKDNVLRSVKSIQNLAEDEDAEDGVQTGFRNRSNIRRLSGIFTPRPFYKSKSINEVNKEDVSRKKSWHGKDESQPGDAKFERNQNEVVRRDRSSPKQKEKSEQIKRMVAAQSLTEFNDAGDSRGKIEVERRRRQHMLDLRFDLAQEAASKVNNHDR